MANVNIECKLNEFKFVDMFLMSQEYSECPPFDNINISVDNISLFNYKIEKNGKYWYIVTT